MDAHLSERSVRLSNYLRPDDEPSFYNNSYNKSTDEYVILDDDEWITRLTSLMEDSSNRMAIFTNSLKEARKIELMALKTHSQDKVILYSSETLNSIKKKHFSDVNKYWKQYDVVICTPTVSAGLSFEVRHFDYIFGYFEGFSCNAETCQQMLGRVRCTIKNKIYVRLPPPIVCDKKPSQQFYTNPKVMEELLISQRADIIKNVEARYNLGELPFVLDGDCEAEYAKDFRYYLTIENMCYDNRSKTFFAKHFRSILTENNYKFGEEEKVVVNNQLVSTYKSQSIVVDEIRIEGVQNAVSIDEKTYEEYMDLARKSEDITMGMKYEIERYKIISRTSLEDEISGEVITTFYSKSHNWKRYFRTIEILTTPGTWEERIEMRKKSSGQSDTETSITIGYIFHQSTTGE
jgi:hypothetical protein